MKRIVSLLLLTLPLVIAALFLPQVGPAFLPQAEVTKLAPDTYQPTVSASGKVDSLRKSEITLKFPFIPKEVMVSVGDQVSAGQTIATVDLPATKEAILNLTSLAELVPSQVTAVLAGMDIDYDLLLSQVPQQITADSSGTVSTLNLVPGKLVYPNESAACITTSPSMRAVLQVSEDFAQDIKVGQKVTLKSNAVKGKNFTGKIATIFPTAQDKLMGTTQETVVGIYVTLDDPGTLKPGYSVTGKIYTGEEQKVQIIPYEAVNQDPDGQEYVYVYLAGKAVRQDVTTGLELEDGLEITSGLTVKDHVVSNCSEIKQDHQFVNLIGVKQNG